MRMIVVTLLPLMLGAGAVLAQTGSSPLGSAPASPRAAAPASPAGKSQANDNIADCMRMWDAGTHMTKQEWSTTCKRVQSRLENLKIDNLERPPKAARKKRQGS